MSWDYPDQNDEITSADFRGNYLLFLELGEDVEIEVGKLGKISFKEGIYVYVGSAMGGFFKRIPRYFKERKKHWHIDYFLDYARILSILLISSKENLEEKLAKLLLKLAEPIPKFGCTDKKSVSHLFKISFQEIPRVIDYVTKFLRLEKILDEIRDNPKILEGFDVLEKDFEELDFLEIVRMAFEDHLLIYFSDRFGLTEKEAEELERFFLKNFDVFQP